MLDLKTFKQIFAYQKLAFISKKFHPKKEIKVLLNLIPTIIEGRRSGEALDERDWKSCASYLRRLMYLLEKGEYILVDAALDQRLILKESSSMLDRDSILRRSSSANLEAESSLENNSNSINLMNNRKQEEDIGENKIVANSNIGYLLTRLVNDFTKALQKINAPTIDYVRRLENQTDIIDIAKSMMIYYQRVNDMERAADMASILV